MTHLREVRLIGAACAFAISPRISARLRGVRGLGDERRGRFPHPAWPHPLDPSAAGTALHRPGARGRTAGRRTRLTLRPDQRGQSLTVRTRPARDRAGQPIAHEPIAQRRHQTARRPAHHSLGAAQRPPQLSPARGRDPGWGEGSAVRSRDRGRRSEGLRRANPGRSASLPLHRLTRGRDGDLRPQDLCPRPDGADGERPRQ